MKILVVNPGSTSLKFKLFDFRDGKGTAPRTIARGKVERIGGEESPYQFVLGEGEQTRKLEGSLKGAAYRQALQAVLDHLTSDKTGRVLASLDDLAAVGFKAVHAGALGRGPGATRLTDDVLRAMERYTILAPAHNKVYLSVIRIFQELTPTVPLAALFEPAFHATIPEERVTYGIPLQWRDKWGIRRYGFHGASHHYISKRIPEVLGLKGKEAETLRLISCHLGGSSSLCAIRGGKSMDTTMGFSTQTGSLHSTRCETIDPFIVLFAIQEMGLSLEEVGRVLCEDSGLKGLSGTSGDFRDLWAKAEGGDPEGARRARLALEVFYYQVRLQIAAMAASLEGVDVICFTGGIGENGIRERAALCDPLAWMGVRLDAEANRSAKAIEKCISAPDSAVAVWTCPTNEELIVAREIFELIS